MRSFKEDGKEIGAVYSRELYELLERKNITAYLLLLRHLKERVNDFLNKKISDIELSDEFVHLFITNENFVDLLKIFEPDIEDLQEGVDVSNPSWSRKEKEDHMKNIIKKIDKFIDEAEL